MYESYLRLTANQLHMRLAKRKLHPAEINKIKDTVAQMKENIRVDKITRANRRTEWTKVLAPLRYELNSAKVGRNYNGVPIASKRSMLTSQSWRSSTRCLPIVPSSWRKRPYR